MTIKTLTTLTLGAATIAITLSTLPVLAFAQTIPASQPVISIQQATTTPTLQQTLLAEIAALEQQLKADGSITTGSTTPVIDGNMGASMPHICLAIARNLTIGSRGADVTQLQETLTQYPTIYPSGSVTGYFGNATAAAVEKLQVQLGIETSSSATGYVGSLTRAALKNGCGGGTQQPGVGTGSLASTTISISSLVPLRPIIASTSLQHFTPAPPTQAQGQINANIPEANSSNQPSSVSISSGT